MGKLLVTVGSTKFDNLINVIDSQEFIEIAKSKGYDEIIVQTGRFEGALKNLTTTFDYATPELFRQYLEDCDAVIGHAGAGTVLEVLELGKPLVVVVNDTLMGNHQSELAEAFSDRGLLEIATVSNLCAVFMNAKLIPKKIALDVSGLIETIEQHFGIKHG